MQSTAPSACWLPVPRGCRWSAVRRRPRSPERLQWTTSYSLSRSSNAPTTSPRLLSSWSPSPLVRRNSDPTNAWMDGEGRGRENGLMHGKAKRDGRGFWERKKERRNMIKLQMGGRGMGSDRENAGCDEERQSLDYAWKRKQSKSIVK